MARSRRFSRKRNPDNKTGLFLLLAAGAVAIYYFSKRSSSEQPLGGQPEMLPLAPPQPPLITQEEPPKKQPAKKEPAKPKVKSPVLASKQKALNSVAKYLENYSRKINANEPLTLFTPLVEDGDPGSKSRAALQTVLLVMQSAIKERKRAEDRFQKPECLWFAWQSEPFFENADKRAAEIQSGKPDWYAGDVARIESLTQSIAPTQDDLWFLYCAARGFFGLSVPNTSSMRDFTG